MSAGGMSTRFARLSVPTDALITLAARVFIMFAGIITAIITARLLGPEGRGTYFYVITLAGFVTQFGTLGLISSNTYLVSRDEHLASALVTNSFVLSLVVLVLAAGIALTSFDTGMPVNLLAAAVVLGTSNLLSQLLNAVVVGLQRITAFNVLQIAGTVLTFSAILVAGLLRADVSGFAWAATLAALASSLIVAGWLFRRIGFSAKPDIAIFRQASGYAGRAFFITLLGYILLRGNVLVLQWSGSTEQVGYYSVAAQIADVLNILPMSLALVLFPRLVREDNTRYASSQRSAWKVIAPLMAVACVVAAILVHPFVVFVFGPQYEPAVPALLAMLPGVLCLAISTILSQYLAASAMPWTTLAAWLCSALAALLTGVMLTPHYGATGAAASLSFGYFILLAAIAAAARHHETNRLEASVDKGYV